jgi:hypothetical protein
VPHCNAIAAEIVVVAAAAAVAAVVVAVSDRTDSCDGTFAAC